MTILNTMGIPKHPVFTITICASMVIYGCSSGGSGNVDLNPASTSSPVITQGRITNGDKISVNGRQFDVSGARFLIGGDDVSQSDISTGMQVTVESDNGSASIVRYDDDVKGPVDYVDPDGSISVMGQKILTTSSTIIEDTSFAALIAGMIVEVSGLRGANDTITATYIERKSNAVSAYEISGVISNFNSSDKTFRLGELTIDYSQAKLHDVGPATLRDGLNIEVKDQALSYEPGSLFLLASSIELDRKSSNFNSGSVGDDSYAGTEFEIEAIVTGILSDTLFTMGTTRVRINESTSFRHGTYTDLAINSRIEVEGIRNTNGEIDAWEIEFDDGDDDSDFHDSTHSEIVGIPDTENDDSDASDYNTVEIEGKLTHFDAETGSLTVDGITVFVANSTQLADQSDHRLTRQDFFSLLELNSTTIKIKWREFTGYDAPPHEVEIED